ASAAPSPAASAVPTAPPSPAPAAKAPSPAPAPAAPAPAAKPAAPAANGKAPVPSAPGQPTGDVGDRLNHLESALASVKDLRDLSELLSIQYNPFLEAEEQAPEERHTAADLLTRKFGPHPEESAAREPPAQPEAAPAPKPQDAAPAPHPEARPPAAVPPMDATANGASDLPHLFGRRGMFADGRPVGGPRETFLAIHWFTYLAQGTDPSIIFLYLDYYHAAGWFGPAEHHWLEGLARGLATPRTGTTWASYGLDARRLAESHLRNLRVLDKLFGATLQHGEAQYLQQTLDALLGEA
ncbi:MAG: hypothetical protein LC623_06330, partial [Halobacteriales archaeon]|nr:hypothetical protein [Halobacteriales archaeon]